MKSIRIFGAILTIGILFLATMFVYGWWVLHRPLDPAGERSFVEIQSGESLESIRTRLVSEEIISPQAAWVHWARLMGKDRFVKSGRYELSAAMSPVQILSVMVRGDVVLEQVTIPEGWIAENIIRRLSADLDIPIANFESAIGDTAWLSSHGISYQAIEGYLFQETYLFARGISAEEILTEMVELGRSRATPSYRGRAAELGLSWHNVLTLASIVEAETAVPEERSRISAVYHNRLRKGWLMQADPTVAYAAGRTGEVLTSKDLEVDSPYNTYIYKGLPPGPICSPGGRSIEAALYPVEGCLDMYFVARGDGAHTFSRTLIQHNEARRLAKQRKIKEEK